jgi:hypothetical protein
MTRKGHSVKSPVFASNLRHTRSTTFFNGEVVAFEGSLDDVGGSDQRSEAAA